MNRSITKALIHHDFKHNKLENITVFLFIFLSVLLLATGFVLIDRLSGSVDHIMEVAQPPHFLQMHVGPYDEEKVRVFADTSKMVDEMQIQSLAEVDGSNIRYEKHDGEKGSFSASILDNYFVIQNDVFDFLLDTNNQIVNPRKGEVGIPVSYASNYDLEVGDQLYLDLEKETMPLTISHLIRDAQMGSSLSSSTRFLVNKEDFDLIFSQIIKPEIILSFLMKDPNQINDFQNLYTADASHMPQNGVAITLPLIRMVNGLGDGLMSGLLILVGILFIIISLVNIRFIILSTLKEEIRQIGTLKAIGMPDHSIEKIYRVKYRLISLSACLIAAITSLFLANQFTDRIQLNFGLVEPTLITYIFPFFLALLLFIIMDFFVARILSRLKKLTILQALIGDGFEQKKKRKKIPKLGKWTKKPVWLLAVHDFWLSKKAWLMLSFIAFVSTVIILIPLNLYHTMSSTDFVQYLGGMKSDLLVSMQWQQGNEKELELIKEELSTNPNIKQFASFTQYKVKSQIDEVPQNLQVEYGTYLADDILLQAGHLPQKGQEIALSVMNMERFEKKIGDQIILMDGNKPLSFTIIGSYQDVTKSGQTAKISQPLDSKISSYDFPIFLTEKADEAQFISKWNMQFPNAPALSMQAVLDQTFGQISQSLFSAFVLIWVMATGISALIVLLFLLLRRQKLFREDAILQAVGFRKKEVQGIYLRKVLLAVLLGSIIGCLFVVLTGSGIVQVIFLLMGFNLSHIPFLLSPLLMILLGIMLPVIIAGLISNRITQSISLKDILVLGNE